MNSSSRADQAKSELSPTPSTPDDQQFNIPSEWYKGLYNKIPCICFTLTTTGIILDANQLACNSLGYSFQELVKKPFVSLFNPDDRERLDSVLSGSGQHLNDNGCEEFRLVASNGGTKWVKLTLDILQPIHQNPVLLVICEDISKSKNLPESFPEVHSQVQLLMNAFPGQVSYIDANRRYQLVSKRYEDWLRVTSEDIIGLTIDEVMPPIQYHKIENYIELALSGQNVQHEFDGVFKDGKEHFILADYMPHFSSSGKVLGVFVLWQDITERKKAEERLRQFNQKLENRVKERTAELEKVLSECKQAFAGLRNTEIEVRKALLKEQEVSELKSRFISTTSHEFRTPLTIVLCSSEMLERYQHRWDEQRQVTHLQRIQTAVKQMLQMLNDLLTIAQTEAGKLEFNPALLDLDKFCRELVEELQHSDGKQHSIVLESQCQSQSVILDAKLLRHIIVNLLSNALNYSPKGSTVRFSILCQEREVIFQIQDWGIGISPQDSEGIFNPFYRAKNVGTIPGMGLGLAIVKQCVNLHKGKITFDSVVGQGTTFTVTLPLGNARYRS